MKIEREGCKFTIHAGDAARAETLDALLRTIALTLAAPESEVLNGGNGTTTVADLTMSVRIRPQKSPWEPEPASS